MSPRAGLVRIPRSARLVGVCEAFRSDFLLPYERPASQNAVSALRLPGGNAPARTRSAPLRSPALRTSALKGEGAARSVE